MVVGRVHVGDDDLAHLAARAGDEHDPPAVGDGLGHRPAGPDRLVVGVGVDGHQGRDVGRGAVGRSWPDASASPAVPSPRTPPIGPRRERDVHARTGAIRTPRPSDGTSGLDRPARDDPRRPRDRRRRSPPLFAFQRSTVVRSRPATAGTRGPLRPQRRLRRVRRGLHAVGPGPARRRPPDRPAQRRTTRYELVDVIGRAPARRRRPRGRRGPRSGATRCSSSTRPVRAATPAVAARTLPHPLAMQLGPYQRPRATSTRCPASTRWSRSGAASRWCR